MKPGNLSIFMKKVLIPAKLPNLAALKNKRVRMIDQASLTNREAFIFAPQR